VLPRGTLPIGVGLLVHGVTSYGFLVLSARALGPERYVGISVLWAVTFLISFGLFLPFELEVARAIAERAVRGLDAGSVFRQASRVAAVTLVVILVLGAISAPVLTNRLFDGNVVLLLSMATALIAYLALHLVRGVLTGTRRLGTYGVILSVEGAIRIGACLALFLSGSREVGPYGVAFAMAPLVAVILILRYTRLASGPPASLSEMSTAIGHLMASAILSQLLLNGPAVLVKVLASPGQQASVGRFLAALVLARVPLYLFTAVLVPLLPKLTSLAAGGLVQDFRAELRRLVRLLCGVVVTSLIGAALVGPWVLRVFFGEEFLVSRSDLTVLAAASGALLMALAWAQALLALGRHARVSLGWLVGVVGFTVAALAPWGVTVKVQMAFLAGSLTAALTLGLFLATSPWKSASR
jgi:O-antigen/teichoic acid export membrane protein